MVTRRLAPALTGFHDITRRGNMVHHYIGAEKVYQSDIAGG